MSEAKVSVEGAKTEIGSHAPFLEDRKNAVKRNSLVETGLNLSPVGLENIATRRLERLFRLLRRF
jgi:hypothetical protein